jgi:hypothetical protein
MLGSSVSESRVGEIVGLLPLVALGLGVAGGLDSVVGF